VTRVVTVAPVAVTATGSVGIAKTVAITGATSGETVTLYDSTDSVVNSDVADGDGNYTFTNVAYGTGYYVMQTVNGVESDPSGTVDVGEDTTKPVITRNGSAALRITVGDTYTDDGATASDNVDGNLTGSIATTGTVDTTTPGEYTIRYNVSDAAGNTAEEVTRVVTVAPAAVTATGGTNTIVVSHAMNGAIVKLFDSSNEQIGLSQIVGIPGTLTFTSVPVGSGYYVTQTVNGIESDASNRVSATAPVNNTPPPVTNTNEDDGVAVIVNGVKQDKTATAKVDTVDNKKVTTITVDELKLNEKLLTVDPGYKVTIPVNNESDTIVGELNAQMVKNMESKEAVLEVQTEKASYTLPAIQVNVDAISQQVGSTVALEDIKIRVEISNVDDKDVKYVPQSNSSIALIAPAVDFKITATHGGQTVNIDKFNAYVERMIAIPDGVDPSKITTGIVVQPDGSIVHVPTKVIEQSGRYYAVINSLTNSVYSVIYNVKTFDDIRNHWAKEAIEDMASRLVIAGKSDAKFAPEADITRAEFTAIMVRALGLRIADGERSFSDVKSGDWYASAVQIAVSYGLIEGYEDGTFRPNAAITREQAMAIIARAMKLTNMNMILSADQQAESLAPFADSGSISGWAKLSAALSIHHGIVRGNDNRLNPHDNITRAETAAIVRKLLQQSDLIND